MRVVSTSTPSPLVPLPLDSQAQLVSDLLNVLIGVASTTFPLNQVGGAYPVSSKPTSATDVFFWGILSRSDWSVWVIKGRKCAMVYNKKW